MNNYIKYPAIIASVIGVSGDCLLAMEENDNNKVLSNMGMVRGGCNASGIMSELINNIIEGEQSYGEAHREGSSLQDITESSSTLLLKDLDALANRGLLENGVYKNAMLFISLQHQKDFYLAHELDQTMIKINSKYSHLTESDVKAAFFNIIFGNFLNDIEKHEALQDMQPLEKHRYIMVLARRDLLAISDAVREW